MVLPGVRIMAALLRLRVGVVENARSVLTAEGRAWRSLRSLEPLARMKPCEFAISADDPFAPIWHAAAIVVARRHGHKLIRVWDSGRTVFLAFDGDVPQSEIVLEAAIGYGVGLDA